MTDEHPQAWRVADSTQIVKDRWIDLRADTCVDGRGRTIAPYYVLNPADWITVLAVDDWGNHTNRSHHLLARGCRRVAAQSLDDSEIITVHLEPVDSLGDRLEQSYHLLTWMKAMPRLHAAAAD
ncbi:hypothetical protein [Microbacterium sp. nov. GSS16]|uniref:hypothetical protein n=1 Tax=Microbacterium sp. nov. GSS16 TaxID=3019890 RepID=UPI0023061582|nr:hypothetical protein [Microbacterium sp. nov. GSS16]WCD91913.1 hypothetical protein PGB26_09510 [Microbacterium sp. nov. GSS16]